MNDETILGILKTDLQISTAALDAYLGNLIDQARQQITTEGITLDADSVPDAMLVEQYAAYLYRSRREMPGAMPRALRWALNNRLFSEKGAAE